MEHAYEIEIKSLLGSRENAEKLLVAMRQSNPGLQELGSHKQLNHYFTDGDLAVLAGKLNPYLSDQKNQELSHIVENVQNFSVRTRQADSKVLFVLKASVDDTTSSNGTARLEFESPVELSLDELDHLILDSGFQYQAKWSRERQEYKYNDVAVSIDKNAGYGYLAEFELVETDPDKAEATKAHLRNMMQQLGVEELPQDRLARMFDYYNANWPDYYGTDKIFTIE
jgi:adenylate cyclase class IV